MYYFLSFVDREQNIHLGCCNVECKEDELPTAVAHDLGINPGGEVMMFEIEELELDEGRLYTPEELKEMGY